MQVSHHFRHKSECPLLLPSLTPSHLLHNSKDHSTRSNFAGKTEVPTTGVIMGINDSSKESSFLSVYSPEEDDMLDISGEDEMLDDSDNSLDINMFKGDIKNGEPECVDNSFTEHGAMRDTSQAENDSTRRTMEHSLSTTNLPTKPGFSPTSSRHSQNTCFRATRKLSTDYRRRERGCQENVSGAFAQLRKLVPTYPVDRKLNKNEILRLTIRYIRLLTSVREWQDDHAIKSNSDIGKIVGNSMDSSAIFRSINLESNMPNGNGSQSNTNLLIKATNKSGKRLKKRKPRHSLKC